MKLKTKEGNLYWNDPDPIKGNDSDKKGMSLEPTWFTCAACWWFVDNTREGAGRRINYILEKGLPENWENQMEGIDLITY